MTFKSDIEEIISSISKQYKDNELAYLSLTSKIELPLRDKIAFELHSKYQDKYLICREWKSQETKSLDRIDLAIIDKIDSKLLCLIEFKAKSVVRFEKEFTRHLADDLIKIRNLTKDNNVELYYVYFNNVISGEHQFANIYQNSVKYVSTLNNNIKNKKGTVENSKSDWEKHIKLVGLNTDKSKHISINAGMYYNYNVSIETFIYGPVNQSEIKDLI